MIFAARLRLHRRGVPPIASSLFPHLGIASLVCADEQTSSIVGAGPHPVPSAKGSLCALLTFLTVSLCRS